MGTARSGPGPSGSPGKLLAIGIAIGVAVSLSAVGALYLLEAPRDWPGSPGETPLGAVLAIGNGTGLCAAGNGSSPLDCAYVFTVNLFGSSDGPTPLSAQDLSFELQDSSDFGSTTGFSVTLVSIAGCGVGAWNSTSSAWENATVSGQCRSPYSLSTPVATGEYLDLTPIPRGGLPFHGEHLIAVANSGGFSGQIGAGID